MKFALHFANVSFAEPDEAQRLGRAAEACGFEALISPEHVVVPKDYESIYPYSATGRLAGNERTWYPDPLIWQTWVAAVTTELRFITGVLILPQRNPVVLAKEIATLDQLSRGRLSLGIGVGWLEEEFDLVGVPFARRGKRADEYIEAMRALWADHDAEYHGEFVEFSGANCNPKPVNRTVPILVGGHTEFAARRAGRLGDGYFPATGSQVDIWPLVELAQRTAADAGRPPLELTTGCPEALPGSGAQARPALDALVERGVSRVALPVTAFLPQLERNLETFAENVIRHYH